MTNAAFALVRENGDLAVTARDQSGFFTPSNTFWLIGCSGLPSSPLGNVELRILDTTGNPIGAYFVGAATVDGSLPDLKLSGLRHPHPLAEPIWTRWRTTKPTVSGDWTQLPPAARGAWLEVTRLHHRWSPRLDTPQGTVVSLPSDEIHDPADFYCAIGEAVNGPGGYFGANLDSLADCLRGGFGITAPFDLTWHPPPDARFAPILDVLGSAGIRLR